MSGKIFSRDGLFRPWYTFLVAGGELMSKKFKEFSKNEFIFKWENIGFR